MTIETNRMWTPEEVAQFFGVPVNTLYQWSSRGKGPKPCKIGRHLRYFPDEVIDYARRNQGAPPPATGRHRRA